jgi:hypothetical protein
MLNWRKYYSWARKGHTHTGGEQGSNRGKAKFLGNRH